MARLFVALVPPAIVGQELADLATPLTGVRWTPVENVHPTLRFIGATDEDHEPKALLHFQAQHRRFEGPGTCRVIGRSRHSP